VPWKETCSMDERVKFIAAVNDFDGSFRALCRQFGIAPRTGYKWVARYEEFGPAGLEDRAPIPRRFPHATHPDVLARVIDLRKEHPSWGPKKLRAVLLASGVDVPHPSTIGELLKRHGLIRPRRRRVRTPSSVEPLAIGSQPNDVWCTDFKGHFALGDRQRCHPLTLTDHASRYLLKCEALAEPTEVAVLPHFDRAFREYGLPDRIRSDNGIPFASTALGGLSSLSIAWIKLGILPERIEPGQPQQNGRHERMHKTLKAETASPPSANMTEQQRAFDRFRFIYNDQRPHEALQQKPPVTRYDRSRRPMPTAPRSPEYPDTMQTRRLDGSGRLQFRAHTTLLTRLLANEPVGLESVDEETWEVFYGPLAIAELRIRNKNVTVRRIA
jgi:transposase InsO family protein